MANLKADLLAKDLVRLMTDLVALHGEMALHMQNKLEAMKLAEGDRVQSITARETVLLERAVERDGLRRQLTRRLLEALGLDPNATLKLTHLAEYLAEPRRSQLLVAAAGLKEKVESVERLRVTTTLVTQEMLKHMREVLSVMRGGGLGAELYSRSGRRERVNSATVFEAVG